MKHKNTELILSRNTSFYISLPNGDAVRIYSNDLGDYCSIEVTTHTKGLELVKPMVKESRNDARWINTRLCMKGGVKVTSIEATAFNI